MWRASAALTPRSHFMGARIIELCIFPFRSSTPNFLSLSLRCLIPLSISGVATQAESMVLIVQDLSTEDGQFDDAPEDALSPDAPADARAGHSYIDDDNILEWSSASEGDEDELEDQFDAEEDEMEAVAYENLRAEDEDWEIAERGALFTPF